LDNKVIDIIDARLKPWIFLSLILLSAGKKSS